MRALAQTVKTTEQVLRYDYLIIVLGSTSHFLGVPGAASFSFPLKTLEQGVALRNRILSCFERAACDSEARSRRAVGEQAVLSRTLSQHTNGTSVKGDVRKMR